MRILFYQELNLMLNLRFHKLEIGESSKSDTPSQDYTLTPVLKPHERPIKVKQRCASQQQEKQPSVRC